MHSKEISQVSIGHAALFYFALVLSTTVVANPASITFAGTIYGSTIPAIPPGTPFSGTFSYDPDAPEQASDSRSRTFLAGVLVLNISGNTLVTYGNASLQVAYFDAVGLPTGTLLNRDVLQFSNFNGVPAQGPIGADAPFTFDLTLVYPQGM